jgi:hypothetical protein
MVCVSFHHPSDGSDGRRLCFEIELPALARNAQTRFANPLKLNSRDSLEFYDFSLARHCFDRHQSAKQHQNSGIRHTSWHFFVAVQIWMPKDTTYRYRNVSLQHIILFVVSPVDGRERSL